MANKKKQPAKTLRQHQFARQGDFKVYVLECSDGSYYTGHTNDLAARILLHEAGKGSRYVRSRRPFKLVYFKRYHYFKPAFKEEFRIKQLTRAEKEKMIKSVVLSSTFEVCVLDKLNVL